MIIQNINTTFKNNNTILYADIIFKGENKKRIFFRINNKYKLLVCNDASPFLAALLLPCMKKGENIFVDGAVPEKQYQNLVKIMKLAESWNAGFSKIHISVKQIERYNWKPKYTGCFFTGGVDSFYTYLKNKKSITHLITIHGCDVPLKDKEFFEVVQKNIEKIANTEKKQLIVIESNYREIIEPILEWEWELGSALAAAGLFIQKNFVKIYIPGGMRSEQVCPYGTHPELDPLWSTEAIQFIHDGCEYSRLQKVIYSISKSSLALRYLRVCCFILKDKYNCNSCFKCLQTKIELYCAGVLERCETLDHNINIKEVKKIYYDCDLNFNLFGEETLSFLRKSELNPQLQEALTYSLKKSKNPFFLRRIVDIAAKLDKKYNNRRIYSFIFGKNETQDRTIFFKTFAMMGLIK